jgi:hypothetical protein
LSEFHFSAPENRFPTSLFHFPVAEFHFPMPENRFPEPAQPDWTPVY